MVLQAGLHSTSLNFRETLQDALLEYIKKTWDITVCYEEDDDADNADDHSNPWAESFVNITSTSDNDITMDDWMLPFHDEYCKPKMSKSITLSCSKSKQTLKRGLTDLGNKTTGPSISANNTIKKPKKE